MKAIKIFNPNREKVYLFADSIIKIQEKDHNSIIYYSDDESYEASMSADEIIKFMLDSDLMILNLTTTAVT